MSEPTQISPTMWLGQPAIAVETSALRLVTVPGIGAKIVSIYDKVAGHEWLLPPVDRPLLPVAYGADFAEQDMSGWDEMFPTIDACAYPVPGPYGGRMLPDHGEVWALPWAIAEGDSAALSLTVEGRTLPYTLMRTISAVDAQTFRLAFAVTNTDDEPFIALWAAHPQFAVDAETRIVLPPSVERVINVQNDDDWGPAGTEYPWPQAVNRHGQAVQLDSIGPASLQADRKFYLPPETPVGWAALQQGVAGAWLRLAWDAADMPYLGIWVDEGSYNAASTAALEPCSGYYDSLTAAWRNGRFILVQGGETVRWHVDIACGRGEMGVRG